jgi:2-methylcitrate dehydratase PrpD
VFLLEELCGWAATLSFDDIPDRVVDLAKSQILSQISAIRAGMSHTNGDRIISALGEPFQTDRNMSATALASLGSWLHFDDTAYAGHLGSSTVAVALACTKDLDLDGRSLLTAIVAANECAARITAAATLGPLRGQLAAHTSIAGAIAARFHAENAPARLWVDAFGLALSMAPWMVPHGLMGSDARLLTCAGPVRMGLDACDYARSGLRGAPDVLEHPNGFLARFASVSLPEEVTTGLGQRWHTDTLSFKVYPAGPGTDAAVEAAIQVHHAAGALREEDVAEIVVAVSQYTVLIEKAAATYIGATPRPMNALVSTTPYPVACALMNGKLSAKDYEQDKMDDPGRIRLSSKVRIEHNAEMTASLFGSCAPFGEALRQAGDRAIPWLEGLGREDMSDLLGPSRKPMSSYENATKVTPARVTVTTRTGRKLVRQVDIPSGSCGSPTRVQHHGLMAKKFLGTGGSADFVDFVKTIEAHSADDITRMISAAVRNP